MAGAVSTAGVAGAGVGVGAGAAETDGTIPLPAQQAPIPKHAAKSQQKPVSGDSDQDFLQ